MPNKRCKTQKRLARRRREKMARARRGKILKGETLAAVSQVRRKAKRKKGRLDEHHVCKRAMPRQTAAAVTVTVKATLIQVTTTTTAAVATTKKSNPMRAAIATSILRPEGSQAGQAHTRTGGAKLQQALLRMLHSPWTTP
jgi:hypothetical protein